MPCSCLARRRLEADLQRHFNGPHKMWMSGGVIERGPLKAAAPNVMVAPA